MKPSIPFRLVVLGCLLALLGSPAGAPQLTAAQAPGPALPAGFVDEVVVTGLTLPTAFDWSADGRLFIAQKDGRVRVVENGGLVAAPFVDLSEHVNTYIDRGLTGLALHPGFPETPYVYLLFAYDPPGVTKDADGGRVSRLIRLSADPTNRNTALSRSEVVLLGKNSTRDNLGDETTSLNVARPACMRDAQPVHDCIPADTGVHPTGQVAFGPDGMLYLSIGDASNVGSADPRILRTQNLDVLSGKLLRIDPATGEGLPDNPFFDGDPAHNRSRVLNYGLRSPFRFTFHPDTGEPIVGDVGERAWEEINSGSGLNFGWPCYEGAERYKVFEFDAVSGPACAEIYSAAGSTAGPRHTYFHLDGFAAVIMGGFYLGESYPAPYRSALFFADYDDRVINTMVWDTASVARFASGLGGEYAGIVQLAPGPDTNLYYLVLDAATPAAGRLHRIRYLGGANAAPIARITAAPAFGAAPLTVQLDGRGSRDPESAALAYAWSLGDGTTSTQPALSHTYAVTGVYTITLTVTDPAGGTGVDTITVSSGNHPPRLNLFSPVTNTRYVIGDVVQVNVTVTDDEDAPFPAANVRWRTLLHHGDHVHPDYAAGIGLSGAFGVLDHGDDTWLEVCATATDSGALPATSCRTILPRVTPVTLRTSPSGLRVLYDGAWRTTPFEAYAPVGAQRTLVAPVSQQGCPLLGWGDGAPGSRVISVATAPLTYTAVYGPCVVHLPLALRPLEDYIKPRPTPLQP